MPFKLTTPQTAPVAATIRITSFMFSAESNVMRVEFIAESDDGIVVERSSELFGADELASVDEHGELRSSMKAALYAMLAARRDVLGVVE